MLPTFTLKFSDAQWANLERELADMPGNINKAAVAAINRTLATAQSRTAAKLSKIINLPRGRVNNPAEGTITKFLSVRKASTGGKSGNAKLVGTFTISRKGLPATLFKPTQNRKGVAITVRKGKRELWKSAFIATMDNGKRLVVERRRMGGGKRAPRFPLDTRYGPTPLGVLEKTPGMLAETLDEMGDTLAKNLASQVDRFLKRKRSA